MLRAPGPDRSTLILAAAAARAALAADARDPGLPRVGARTGLGLPGFAQPLVTPHVRE